MWGTVWAHAFHKGSKLTLVDREKHKINPPVKLLSTNKQDVWRKVLWKQASGQGKQKRGNTTHVKWNSRIWLVRSNVLFLFEPKPIIASIGHFLSLYQWHLKQDKWRVCKTWTELKTNNSYTPERSFLNTYGRNLCDSLDANRYNNTNHKTFYTLITCSYLKASLLSRFTF